MRYRTSRTWTLLLIASLTGCNFAERRSEGVRPAKCISCSSKPTSQTVPDCTPKTSASEDVDRAAQKPLGICHSLPSNAIAVLPRVTLRAAKCLPCESSINNATSKEVPTAPPTAPSSDAPIPSPKPQTMPATLPETSKVDPPKKDLPKTDSPKPKALPEQKPVEPILPKAEPKPPVEPPKTVPPVTPQAKPAEPLKLNADKLPPLSANVNRAPDFKWVAGVVSYSYVTRAWHLRYAPIDAADEFGGSITLIGSEFPYKDGQFVRVEGELISRAHATAPPYRVHKIEPSTGK